MKKLFLIATAAVGMMTANAQQALEATNFGSNWSVGIDGGATSPLKSPFEGKNFIDNARAIVGAHVAKQLTPVVGVGIEGVWGINTSYQTSKNIFDTQYVGLYGTANLMNLFGGYKCDGRFFDIDAVLGAGWMHTYVPYTQGEDFNTFASKAGLNFNFNVTKNFTISLKPSVSWNMVGEWDRADVAYDVKKANFNVMVGLTYKLGKGFVCVEAADPNAIAALNAEINNLRAQLDGCMADLAASTAANAALASQLEACLNRPAKVVEKVSNNLESVRYIYFAQSSSTITAEQMRTVDILASYMKNHKDSKLDVKGYASPEGNLDFNIKLANARAESVKKAIVKKGIDAARVAAEGKGIGDMFSEPTWNRVAICTLD